MLHSLYFFFFNDTATTEIYTLSLHDALPIYARRPRAGRTLERQRRQSAPVGGLISARRVGVHPSPDRRVVDEELERHHREDRREQLVDLRKGDRLRGQERDLAIILAYQGAQRRADLLPDARDGHTPLVGRPGRRHEDHHILALQRGPCAGQELLAVESDRGRVAGLAHLQGGLPGRRGVRPAAHEPVDAPIGEARREVLPRLLAEQQGEHVGNLLELAAGVVATAHRGGERCEERQRRGVAHGVGARELLVHRAERPVGGGDIVG